MRCFTWNTPSRALLGCSTECTGIDHHCSLPGAHTRARNAGRTATACQWWLRARTVDRCRCSRVQARTDVRLRSGRPRQVCFTWNTACRSRAPAVHSSDARADRHIDSENGRSHQPRPAATARARCAHLPLRHHQQGRSQHEIGSAVRMPHGRRHSPCSTHSGLRTSRVFHVKHPPCDAWGREDDHPDPSGKGTPEARDVSDARAAGWR